VTVVFNKEIAAKRHQQAVIVLEPELFAQKEQAIQLEDKF
jgi:hypothetical protein